MSEKPLLLPYPRHLEFTEGSFTSDDAPSAIRLTCALDAMPQSYGLAITPDGIDLTYRDPAGLYYARQTLGQLIQQYGKTLPAMTITDSPDFLRRGVMLDCSRDRVPTMATLYGLIDKLAAWKINEFQLYLEHTYAYPDHREVWTEASPFTGEELRALDAYCRAHHIDLVPCQATLGHMERWLKHPRYHDLAEAPDGFVPPWEQMGKVRAAGTLDPNDEGSLDLVAGLFDALLPNFTSEFVNICNDEPFELGMGKSRAAVEAGGGRVYLDYLLKLYQHITARGKTVLFWADIITQHPDLVPELPSDIIPLIWGYEDWQPSEEQCKLISSTGLHFYICPGTSSWNTVGGRTANALGNLRNAAHLGEKYHARGYLNTDWGDNGHWQALPISYLGFAYGAAVCWCDASNRDADVPTLLSRFAFADAAGVMGRIAYDLGNIYQMIPLPQFNSQWLFHMLQWTDEEVAFHYNQLIFNHGGEPLTRDLIHSVIARIEAILRPLESAQMAHEDALIKSEFRLAADLLLHGARRTLRFLGAAPAADATLKAELEALILRQKQAWLARSRPGGLFDSITRFKGALESYQA